jgi:hypothetical protein
MGIIRDWAAYTGGAQGIPAETGETLRRTLGQMYRVALNDACGNHEEAEKKLAESINNDRRFDPYPTDRLVSRFRECFRSGASLDFDDPQLKGGAPRPGGLIGRSGRLD